MGSGQVARMVEDLCNQVRTVRSSLPWKQLLSNLRPQWVCGHGEEEVDVLVIASDSHTVLEKLLHEVRTAGVRGGKDDELTKLSEVDVLTVTHGILQAAVD